MLLSLRLNAQGETEITGEDSLAAVLGLLLLAEGRVQWMGAGALTYDDNLAVELGQVYAAVGWLPGEEVTIRTRNALPEVTALLRIGHVLTMKKLFVPVKVIRGPEADALLAALQARGKM